MVNYKLVYFNGRGAGEVIRQIFSVAKVDFEDKRVSRDDWPALKASMPFGQMPVLEEDGKQLAQSLTIARYLSRKFGLAGKNAWEEAQVDALADQWKDFTVAIRPYVVVLLGFGQGDLEKLKEETFIPAIKQHFPFFVNALKKSGRGYLVGDSLTYVDLIVAEFVAQIDEKSPQALDGFPELREHYKKVHSNPELKKWRESRPETPF